MSVAQARREINLVEFVYWQAFYKIQPFGEQMNDFRNGYLMSLLANINRDPKAKRTPFNAADFMPFMDRLPTDPQSIEDQVKVLDRYVKRAKDG